MSKSTGPACGNNPNHPLTDGDRQAVADFKAYLADRAALRDRIAEALYAHDHPSHLVSLNETGMGPAYRESADAVLAVLPPPVDRADELASLAVNAGRALSDEKRHYEIACEENARLRATIERVRRLHDNLDTETDLASPDDEITRGAAARKIAAALDGWTDPAELRRMADGPQPPLPRCTCGETVCESELCDCDSAPCPVDHADEVQQPAECSPACSEQHTYSPGCALAADEAQQQPETLTARELAHAIDNSTPYPIEIRPDVCQFMAERLLEMLTIGKRDEHPLWKPEEEPPPGPQPEPMDPATLATDTGEEPRS